MRNRSTKQSINELAIKALEHVQSVDYAVSARWLFYRLLQDGFYKEKDDYKKFIQLISKWRHENFEGWKADTLADETRHAIIQGIDESTPLEEMADSIIDNLSLWTKDSHFKYQGLLFRGMVRSQSDDRAISKVFTFYCSLCVFRPDPATHS